MPSGLMCPARQLGGEKARNNLGREASMREAPHAQVSAGQNFRGGLFLGLHAAAPPAE